MNALELLLNRHSVAALSVPAPEGIALENIIKAGLRAPDHGHLTPWKFVIAQGEGLEKLADILSNAAKARNEPQAVIDKFAKAPFRAPMVITVIAKVSEHPKVPPLEQYLSAGCAVQAMQMAAMAQGFQGIWRSGDIMHSAEVAQAFALKGDDKLVGFLYLGTPSSDMASIAKAKNANVKLDRFVTYL